MAKDRLQKAETITDVVVDKLRASPRTFIYVVVAAVLFFALGWCSKPAQAGGYDRGGAAAFADAHAVGEGGSVGAVTQQGGSVSNSSKSYAVGMSDLTTSGGECPMLGSFSVFLVAGTYEVPLCATRQAIKLMDQIGMLRAAAPHPSMTPAWSAACQVASIGDAHPWCAGKMVRRGD